MSIQSQVPWQIPSALINDHLIAAERLQKTVGRLKAAHAPEAMLRPYERALRQAESKLEKSKQRRQRSLQVLKDRQTK